jgi:hypothetical protein
MTHVTFEDHPLFIELKKYYNESSNTNMFNGDYNKFYQIDQILNTKIIDEGIKHMEFPLKYLKNIINA